MKARESLPRTLGRYEVVLPIASGGMGVVYLGRSIGAHGFNREVAIKVVRPDREATPASDLVREARIAGLVRHLNVVQVLDVGDEDGEIYLVMEFIEGDSLHGMQRAAAASGRKLQLEVGLRILLDGLAGLHAAHELRGDGGEPLGLVHRDFSPQNLLVGVDGSSRLTDFGIAKLADAERQTTTGTVKGKFAYLSPEQARSDALDRRSDVWSASVVAWEIMTGRKLYPAGNEARTLLAIVQDDPPDPREFQSEIPAPLADAVMCGLSRPLRRRCPTASALSERLREAARTSEIEIASNEQVTATLRTLVGGELQKRQAAFRQAMATPTAAASARDPGPQGVVSPAVAPPQAAGNGLDTSLAGERERALVETVGSAVTLPFGAPGRAAPLQARRPNRAKVGVVLGIALTAAGLATYAATQPGASGASTGETTRGAVSTDPEPAPGAASAIPPVGVLTPTAAPAVSSAAASTEVPSASARAVPPRPTAMPPLKAPAPSAKVKCSDWGRCR